MIFTDSRNLLPIPKLGKSCRNLRHDRVEPLAAQADSGQWAVGTAGGFVASSAQMEVILECRIYSTVTVTIRLFMVQDRYQYVSGTGATILAIVWQ